MRKLRSTVLLAWGISAIICALAVYNAARVTAENWDNGSPLSLAALALIRLFPVFFAVPATLIITRQPRNIIGWLLMTPALGSTLDDVLSGYLAGFQTAPPPATLLNLFAIMLDGGSWLTLIFPLLLVPLLFPTGRPLGPRWRWVLYLAGGMILFFIFWMAGMRRVQPEFATWTFENPIGFLPDAVDQVFMLPWSTSLALLAIASLASIIIRYRQAAMVEREQMKWLLYACAVFGLVFIPSVLLAGVTGASPLLKGLFDLLFALSILTIPAAVAIAILRYHLFDIDIIIRLTLVYATITALLALVYAGGIVLLQEAFRRLTGQTSDLAIVVTTLAIVTLFNPLRMRVQTIIDRRYYRTKYNAEVALSNFANAARGGANLDEMSGMLTELVLKTLQPTQVSLQLKTGEKIEAVARKSPPSA